MGTYAYADAFYGISWDPEELPEKWANTDNSSEIDMYDELESLVKELGFATLLDVSCHGNMAYGYTGYYAYVRGAKYSYRLGGAQLMQPPPDVSPEAEAAISMIADHLGRENATIGWQIAVSYG